MDDKIYMAVPTEAIVPGALPEFKIYIPSPKRKGKYVLWALEGNKVNPEQLAKLFEGGIKEIFVDIEEKFKYEQYLEENLENILENQFATGDQKAKIFSQVSTNVVKNAFETSLGLGAMSRDAMRRTQRMVQNALIFIAESKSLTALAKMIGHDYQTYEHAAKVLWFTAMFLWDRPYIMERIHPGYRELDETNRKDVLRQCGVAALLHDIGKAFISIEILNKNGSITDVEREIMKSHPLNGLAMLIDSNLPIFVKKAVLQHHEDFNGDGYPMGLEGRNITVLARVLRIIDVFDAMTSQRPYKDSISPLEAMAIMVRTPPINTDNNGSGRHNPDDGMKQCFDEDLLGEFITFLGDVKLS